MLYRAELRNERGIALVVVLLVVLAIAAIAAGAAFLGSNTTLINKFHERLSVSEAAADAGLEEARSAVNGNKAIYPASGYNTLENGVAVYSASGAVIPNIKRWIYLGPTGITSGQYGVFGSAVVVVQDAQGNRVVRRGEIYQESFAKYAYFTNTEGAILFSVNDVLWGPVFSNDVINIQAGAPGALFNGPVGTAKTITNRANATYKQGYTENAQQIKFPDVADLNALKTQAVTGNTSITSTTAGSTAGQATTRIEFVALDLDADGDSTDSDEGFMRIYQVTNNANAWWVVADTGGSYGSYGANGLQKSRNCGHINGVNPGKHNDFKTFAHHAAGAAQDLAGWALTNGTQRRCYLGGSDILNDWTAPQPGVFLSGATAATSDTLGKWLPWTGTVDSRVTAVRPDDAAYLWPISRALNPNFKGVIYVEGRVAISGKVRGQVTLAATDNIIIADDITYVSNPAATTPCASPQRDILGLFSGTSVVIADNLLNDPIASSAGGNLASWGATPDEFIHAVVLALTSFSVESWNTGPSSANPPAGQGLGAGAVGGEPCSGTNWGRGCLYLTGGIIQYQRGPVGLADGHGYLKRYQYDNCASTNPPPYFPTTGHFVRGHFYEVEPTGFNIATYWPLLIP